MIASVKQALLDPRIGILASGRHYAYAYGHRKEPVYGTREEVEAALGIVQKPEVTSLTSRAPSVKLTVPLSRNLKEKKGVRAFLVTVTPRFVTYAGSATCGEYKVIMYAKTRGQAISHTREDRRSSGDGGRHGVPSTFTARLATEREISDYGDECR